MIGPLQYRINRGTALKWIQSMRSTEWLHDGAQLSYMGPDDVTYGSAEGVLAAIAEPNPSVAWDGVSHRYDGQQFFLSNGLKKRLKVKGTLPDFESFDKAIESAEEMLAHFQ